MKVNADLYDEITSQADNDDIEIVLPLSRKESVASLDFARVG
ncbi:MAG: hypothetical protein ACI9A7_001050 [Cyclobacteriaceae bacterium]|jgi:hypothetical protein